MQESMDCLSTSAAAEDAVMALMEYLVAPMLPFKSSSRDPPSLSLQESVAKQVHAVVLLYSYYYRKQHPEAELLDFKSFCQLAVVVKPTLMGHMKLMHHTDFAKLDDVENQLSVTEKAIMDACDISSAVDPSKNIPNTENWEVSKIAVLLTDSNKENCLLQFSSTTQGVWSVIEKNVPGARRDGEDRKHISKRRRCNKKSLGDGTNSDKATLQELALSAVTEATGINHGDLVVLKSHTVYSLSREKSAVQFYIIQSTVSIGEELLSIKNIIRSLQGPLIKKRNFSWEVTPTVEYFQLLPYAGVMEDWFSREVMPNQDLIVEMETVDVESFQNVGNFSANEDIDDSKCKLNVKHSADMQSHGTDKLLQHQNIIVKVNDKDEVDCREDDNSTKIVANGCNQTYTHVSEEKNGVRSVMVHKSDSLSGSENIGNADCSMLSCSGDGKIGNVDVLSYQKIDNHLNTEILEHKNDDISSTGSKSDAQNIAVANYCIKAGEIKNAGAKSFSMIDNLPDNFHVQKNENASVMVCKSDSLGGSKDIGTADCSTIYCHRAVEGGDHDSKSCEIIYNLFNEEVSKDILTFNEKTKADDSNVSKINGIYANSSKQTTAQPMDTDETSMMVGVSKYGLKYNRKTNTDSNDKKQSDNGSDLNHSGAIVEFSRQISDNGSSLNQSGENTEFSRQTNDGTNTSEINAESSKQITCNGTGWSGVHDFHTYQQTMDSDGVCKYGLKLDKKTSMDCEENMQREANVEFSEQRSDKIELSGLLDRHTTKKNKDSGDSLMIIQQENGNKLSNGCTITKVYCHKKRTSSSYCNTNSNTGGFKVKVEIDNSKSNLSIPKLDNGKREKGNETSRINSSNRVGPVTGDWTIVPHEMNVDDQDKLQVTRASEQNALSQTALTFLLRKKSKLCHQLRLLEDEIAVCDKSIQTILDGGESELMLQIEAIVDACYDDFLKGGAETQELACQRFGTQVSSQLGRKRLSDAVIPSRNFCQELDDICHKNLWTLPTYQLYPVDGGFWASIKLKGADFEYCQEGDLCVKPSLARELAAEKMIAKLQTVATQKHKFPVQQ